MIQKVLFYFVLFIPFLSCTSKQKVCQTPNVVLILCDDLGYSDLGCFGSEIHTPNLNRLAEEGLRMTQFYNAAKCCPTRASLLTGLNQFQAGVGHMDSNLGTPEYQGFLNDRCITLAELLKNAGYNTYMSGKWHVGREKGHWPLDRGFDRYYGLIDGATNYYNIIAYDDTTKRKIFLSDSTCIEIPGPTESDWAKNQGFYTTDAFTDYALRFLTIQEKKENPFFLYIAYNAPHWPLHAFPEDIEKYTGRYSKGWDSLRIERYQKQIDLGIIDPGLEMAPLDSFVVPWNEAEEHTKREFELEMALYAAVVDRMDQNIGRVISKLEDMDVLKNTLIIFLSDNGGCHTTPAFEHLQGTPGGPNSFPCYGFMGAEVSNVPFRYYKQFIHEGGISTPFIAYYSNMISPGAISGQPAHIIDIMPTISDLCDIPYPDEFKGKNINPLQGESLKPVFQGKEINRLKPLFWEHMGSRGVRNGDWKLVSSRRENVWELYNMETDRTELNNLADHYPEKRDHMIQLYEEWAEENGILPWPHE